MHAQLQPADAAEQALERFPFSVDPDEKFDAALMVRLPLGGISVIAWRDVCVACGELCAIPGLCQLCVSEGRGGAAPSAKPAEKNWPEELVKRTHDEVNSQRAAKGLQPHKFFDGRSKQMKRSDGNDYTPLTDAQITEIRELRGQGLTIRQVAQRVKVQEWRVQRVSATKVVNQLGAKITEINRSEDKPQDNTHVRAEAIINAPAMSREEYVQQFGELGQRSASESTLKLWARIEQLATDSVLVLPMKIGETTNAARSRYQNIIYRCVRMFKPKFRVQLTASIRHHHVVLQKVLGAEGDTKGRETKETKQ